MTFLPNVIFKENDRDKNTLDIYSRLLKLGIIFLTNQIDMNLSGVFMAQLMYTYYDLGKKEITIYINSPGGCVSSSMAMINWMNYLKNVLGVTIVTVCCGMAASAASIILSNGSAGKRFILKYGKVMIHQPIGGIKNSQATDIIIYAMEIEKIRSQIAEIYTENCAGKTSKEDFLKYMERDKYLLPEEALELGLIDGIM